MIHFYKLTEKEPDAEKPILIKLRGKYYKKGKYYVVAKESRRNRYTEYYGEEYSYWLPEDIEGWCDLSAIEENETWN